MWRFSGLVITAGLLLAASPGQVAAAEPSGETHVSPMQLAKTERQKCRALNRCRQKYTHCYNRLEAQHKLDQKDEVCVKPYQDCIHSNFAGMDWFLTRWFNPNYLDCSKYPG